MSKIKKANRGRLGVMLLLASASASASANLITNGDFSSGTLSGWTTFDTSSGVGNPSVAPFNVTGAGASLAAKFHVGQLAYVDGVQEGGGIFQNFVSGDGTFNFSADIAAIAASMNGSYGMFSLILDGNTLTSYDFGDTIIAGTYRRTLSASAPMLAGTHELRILITRPYLTADSTPDSYVDNIAVNLTGVPEPATLALFAIGLVGAGWTRRKPRHQA